MTFTGTLALVALVVFWYVFVLFCVALIRRNNGVADVAWPSGILLAALVALWANRPSGLRPVLVTVLIGMWALRLVVHLGMRGWGQGEDRRHAGQRSNQSMWWPLQVFFRVFLLRAFLLLVVASPALYVNTHGGPVLGWLDAAGAAVWLLGFLAETVADSQLVRFLKDPANRGRILRSGLWRYSRHPNYFGEIMQWSGLWLIALAVPDGWITILGPLTIAYLIVRVSGVPVLERRFADHAEFQEYAARTSALVLWMPKKSC